jgi:methyl-accepting chemotaxis protein
MHQQPKRGLQLMVRGRILLLFAICTFLVIATAAFGFWRFSASLEAFDRDVMSRQTNAIDVEAIEINFKKQVQEWKDTLLRGKKPEALDKHWTAFQQREGEVRTIADTLSRSIADTEAAQLVAQFLTAHKTMGDAYRRGLQEFRDHDFDSAAGDKAVAGIDRAPTELLGKAKERLLALAHAAASEAREEAHRTTWMTILLLSLATAAGAAVFLIAVQRSISVPLTRVVHSLSELAAGNTAAHVHGLERGDEIGKVADAVQLLRAKMIEADQLRAEQSEVEQRLLRQRQADMNELANSFEATVGDIVETVSSASSELEVSAKTLTASAESAQTRTTMVAAASEEASTNVQSVASATEEMASSINEVSRQVQESARMASDAVGQARNTTDRVSELSKAAARIGDVVELINTIAGQTNLLALNATIEAARAGESGRGFAVVASEVKALSEQTAKATGEIGEQISGIQTATQQSVGAIREISGTIEKLSEISSAIAAAVEEQGMATQEISRNVEQAAQGTRQVSSSITDVQRGASETGSASSQVLSAAQTLSRDSDRLRREVAKFLGTVRAA